MKTQRLAQKQVLLENRPPEAQWGFAQPTPRKAVRLLPPPPTAMLLPACDAHPIAPGAPEPSPRHRAAGLDPKKRRRKGKEQEMEMSRLRKAQGSVWGRLQQLQHIPRCSPKAVQASHPDPLVTETQGVRPHTSSPSRWRSGVLWALPISFLPVGTAHVLQGELSGSPSSASAPKVTPKLLEGNSKKSPLAQGPACRTKLSPPASPQWDGDLWAPPSLPSPASSPEQVSCTRTCTRCWARTKAKAPAEIVSSSRGREQDYFCTSKCNPGISQLLSFAALKTLSQRRARAQFLQTPTRARSWSGPALF